MRIVLLGKPMSGKGTQAQLLAKTLRIPHISTGDLLRDEVGKKTKLGLLAKKYMNKGALLPDDVMFALLRKRLPTKGFILDGFPRDVAQARELDEITAIDLVIDFHCTDSIIIRRTLARRVCRRCHAIYGLDVPPKKKGICDACGGRLYQRADDNRKTITKRLRVYNEKTAPLIAYYKKQKRYFAVDGEKPISVVQKAVLTRIERIK